MCDATLAVVPAPPLPQPRSGSVPQSICLPVCRSFPIRRPLPADAARRPPAGATATVRTKRMWKKVCLSVFPTTMLMMHRMLCCTATLAIFGATAQADLGQHQLVAWLAAALLSALHLAPWEERLEDGNAHRLKQQASKSMMQHAIAQLTILRSVPSARRMVGTFSPFCNECGSRMYGLTQVVSDHIVIKQPGAFATLAMRGGRAIS